MDPSQVDQILANLIVNARDAIDGTGRITIETGNRVVDKEYCAGRLECIPGEYVTLTVSDTGWGINLETHDEHLRAVLHDQGRGPGNRARAGHGVRHRAPE